MSVHLQPSPAERERVSAQRRGEGPKGEGERSILIPTRDGSPLSPASGEGLGVRVPLRYARGPAGRNADSSLHGR
jgi:hypothetical protein